MNKIFLLLICSILSLTSYSQTDGDYRTNASGSWNTASNWDVYDEGTSSWSVASTVPDLTIAGITVTVNHTMTGIPSLTVDCNLIVSHDVVFNMGSNDMDGSGLITFHNGVTFTCNNFDIASSEVDVGDSPTINVNGDFSSSLAPEQSTVVLSNTGTLATGEFYTLTISSGTRTLSGSITINNSFTISSGATFKPSTSGILCWGQSVISGKFEDDSNTGNNNFMGKITINSGGEWVTTSVTTNGRLILRGGLTNNGSFSAGVIQFATGDQVIDGASAITINGAFNFGSAIKVTNSNTNTSSGLVIKGTMPGVASSTFENKGLLTWENSAAPMSTNGTFTVSDAASIVRYNRAGTQTIKGADYTKLYLANSDAKSLNNNTTVNGELKLEGSASLNLNSKTLTYGSNAVLIYEGSSSQTSSSAEWPASGLNNVTINNASGVVLHDNRQIDGTLSLSNGDLSLNGNTLTLGSSANLTETAGNTVKGTTGKLTTLATNLNAPSAVNINNLGIVISSAANMGSTTIERFHNIPTGNGGNEGILRRFKVTPTNNTGLNATIVIHYDESELNGIPETNLILFKSTDGGANWIEMPTSVDANANTITINGIDGFSDWTVGNSAAPLPVELMLFAASVDNNIASLNWTTATETNNAGFSIERSSDGKIFEDIGFVTGAGNSNSMKSYEFEDNNPLPNISYYRLKQQDYDGAYIHSAPVSINNTGELITRFFVHENGNLSLITSLDGSYKIRIFDLIGREVFTGKFENSGSSLKQINAPLLSNSIYLIRIELENTNSFQAFKFQLR